MNSNYRGIVQVHVPFALGQVFIGCGIAVPTSPEPAAGLLETWLVAKNLILGKGSGVVLFQTQRGLDENPVASFFALTPKV